MGTAHTANKTFRDIAAGFTPETRRETIETAGKKLNAHLRGGTQYDVQSIQEFIDFATATHKSTKELVKSLTKLTERGGFKQIPPGLIGGLVEDYEKLEPANRFVCATASVALPRDSYIDMRPTTAVPADLTNSLHACKDEADTNLNDLSGKIKILEVVAYGLDITMRNNQEICRPGFSASNHPITLGR